MAKRREDLEHEIEEGLSLLVGMAVLGLQRGRATARRVRGAPLPERLAKIAEAVAEPVIDPLRTIVERARAGHR